MALTPLDQPPLSELAYRQIREAIVAGTFAMGEQLVEARLVNELRVSRAPIRESLRRLAAEGLVVEQPRRGTFVRVITASNLIDICNTRLGVESVAARLIVRGRRSVANLESCLSRMAAAADGGDRRQFAATDLAFHAELCACSGNGYLEHVFSVLAGQIEMAITIDEEGREDLHAVVVGHRPLIDVLRDGDEGGAELAVQSHVLSSVRAAVSRLGGDPDQLLGSLIGDDT